MRRLTSILFSFGLAALLAATPSVAAEPEWHSEQPVAAGIGVPVPLGEISGMAFWAPNKGVLVTAGNGGMPAGVYAYDGSGWYLYSTVCGGHEGGIAISGPDEFWTIADYAEAQEGTNEAGEQGRTLCHFANGEVVASYAEPAASPGAFSHMHAAACAAPAECWFAGATPEKPVNRDPFHLHWDGGSLTAVPSLTALEPGVAPMGGIVESLAFAKGRLFESASEKPYLREVSLSNAQRFLQVEPLTATPGPFVLSSEPLRQELWAGSSTGAVLRLGSAGFEVVQTASPTFEQSGSRNASMIGAIGGEPGTEGAWLGGGGQAGAEVRHVDADGALGPIVRLPQAGEELNPKGAAEQIFCPVAGQCWMATRLGWLFHLGGPPPEGINTDPLMHRLITQRPKDASSRTFVPPGLPEDNSGELENPRSLGPGKVEPIPVRRPRRCTVKEVHEKVLGKRVLQLSFRLCTRAHVQLRAKFHGKVVAKTSRLVLAKGPHKLHLKLDPKRWPTGLSFQVHPVAKKKK